MQSGHGHGAIHFEALTTTLRQCGELVRKVEIFGANQLPTSEQLWDMVKNNRVYVYNMSQRRWFPEPRASEYVLAGNILPNVSGLRSLLKPLIGRRVARMHGMAKARWESEASAF
ncbi:hypothetical protein Rt10032_c11g4668 [Rhodotorula toruloides]|uniref:Uncharacterized protein n=1 Tax=Rhodotorula toruloides TaxID=5286 RepID=A0A511KJT5_RHOTO|nr:hypothetical protein Rt10032_c11g4668 [Rhodotorula toruloides]